MIVYDLQLTVAYTSPGTDPATKEAGNLIPVTDRGGDRCCAFLLSVPVTARPWETWLPGLVRLVGAPLLLVGR